MQAQQLAKTKIDAAAFSDDSNHWYAIADAGNIINPKPNQPRFKVTDLIPVADNILLYQKQNGGWPKNYDMLAILTDAQKDSLLAAKNLTNTTYDNGTTYTQITCLANVYAVVKDEKYKKAVLKGLDFILASQYENGGWPQFYPLEDNYSRLITYNDGAFEGIMRLLQGIAYNQPEYSFISGPQRAKLVTAYQKGINCILNTQIIDNGVPTAWCQQYNEATLQPAWARAFEPPSICNGESSGLVLFLMSVKNPSVEIVHAINTAVIWFRSSEIENTRIKTVPAPAMQTKFRVSKTDKMVINDAAAPVIWTRYYELKTHRPMFCNRDSKVVYSLAEVARERRDGYAWYTYAPQKVLDKYPDWLQQQEKK